MDENLQLVINHYEIEQQLLQSLLDECLLEKDYKYAKYYLKNLRLLQKTLFNLYALSDYNHAEKTEVLRQISNSDLMLQKQQDDFFKKFAVNRSRELNVKLSALNKMPVVEVEEKNDLENAIIRLLEKDIKRFKLFILRTKNFYMDFSLQRQDIVRIEFTPFKNFYEYFSISDFEIQALQRIGFMLNQDRLYINFDLTNQSTQAIKIFLSRIFFEVFYWHSRKGFELEILN